MSNWFSCKIKYQRELESGKIEKTTEQYLVQAISYTDAEARIYSDAETRIQGEFMVDSISKSNLNDVIPFEDSVDWYKVKCNLIAFDEETEKEKKTSMYLLIAAFNIKVAYERIENYMKDSMSDYVIESIAYTKILDVIPIGEQE